VERFYKNSQNKAIIKRMDKKLFDSLKPLFEGDIDFSEKTLKEHARDASLFEIMPEVVLYPKHGKDIQAVVSFVNKNKKEFPTLSITARSAGTDMTGGPLNQSIILDFTRYMNKVKEVNLDYAIVEPGCYYRDFDKETRKKNRMMPAYTASREICAVGGMTANNSGGEKSVKYGKVENYMRAVKIVLSDGNEYTVKPLSESEIKEKISGSDFESELYKKLYDLITSHLDEINSAKPDVSKNWLTRNFRNYHRNYLEFSTDTCLLKPAGSFPTLSRPS
jgi:FAD/FMN-containing dehydrogenase